MESESAITLDQVSRTFRSFWGRSEVRAVQELSLQVKRGEIFGLLGPNGSGKTTTIQMILGLLAPTRGRLTVLGRSPGDMSTRRQIGYLPEEFSGQDFLTGEETLVFYGSFFGLGRAEVRKRTSQYLRDLDLWNDRRRQVKEYSKGMRRRIGLAQCLLHDPELIILDEPTNGLDPLGIKEVQRLLIGLKERGRTVLVTSHILSEMEDLCDRVAILHRGKSLVSGNLGELLSSPDRHRIMVKGKLPPREEIEGLLTPRGLSVEAIEPDHSTLEELFLRIVTAEKDG